MDSKSNRDPLAITIAVVSLVTQIGLWFWWGGKLTEKVDSMERRVTAAEADNREHQVKDGQQDTQLAVTITQYGEISRRLGIIEGKLDRERPDRP